MADHPERPSRSTIRGGGEWFFNIHKIVKLICLFLFLYFFKIPESYEGVSFKSLWSAALDRLTRSKFATLLSVSLSFRSERLERVFALITLSLSPIRPWRVVLNHARHCWNAWDGNSPTLSNLHALSPIRQNERARELKRVKRCSGQSRIKISLWLL